MLVLTSELATNAVLHARTPFEVSVTVTDEAVLVCVGDGMDGHPRSPVQSEGRENGRGIVLVRALADEWGVQPGDGPGGKAVWFLFHRAAASGRGAGVEGRWPDVDEHAVGRARPPTTAGRMAGRTANAGGRRPPG